MILQLLFAIFLGIIAGIITGLVPGIHVNLITVLLLNSSGFLLRFFSLSDLIVFIVAMATTHTFLDAVPSIFLGAPESATALGVLPGHRYLLIGHGLMALKLTVIGSLSSLLIASLLFFVLTPVVVFVYSFLKLVIGYLLVVIAFFIILRNNDRLWSALVMLLSGLLGLLVFDLDFSNPLFPLLSGLFGLSTLIYSLFSDSSLPEQFFAPHTDLVFSKSFKAVISSSFSGLITAVLPGVGAATAALISLQFTKKIGDHGFMILIGGISTANFVFSILTFNALGKARNGAVLAVKSLLTGFSGSFFSVSLLMILSSLIAGGFAAIIALFIGKYFLRLINLISYKKITVFIIFFIIILTPLISGFYGLLVLLVATAVGLLPAVKRVSRTSAMGCLLLPVIFYFL